MQDETTYVEKYDRQPRRFESPCSASLQTSPQSNPGRWDKKPSNFGLSNYVVSPKQPLSRTRRVLDDLLRISENKWTNLEKQSQEEQRQFLNQYKSQFQKEPVDSQMRNVKRGDHICYPGSIGIKKYEHHLLCTEVYGDDIKVIEYNGPSFGFSASSQSSASKNPLAFAQIKTATLKYKDLMSKKAQIIKWPKELERFTVHQVIARARGRKWERLYNALDNNCEHFVMWCKCGLNTSLQIEPWYRTAWECIKAVGNAGLQSARTYGVEAATPLLARAAANVSDELAGIVSSSLSPIGFGVGAVIEVGISGYDIYKDYKKMKQGVISKSRFRENTVNTSCKTGGRVAGGIAGSIIGAAVGPLGSVVGGAVGWILGHFTGSALATAIPYVPKIATAVKDTLNTCASYVKKGIQKVKGFFESLFSWW